MKEIAAQLSLKAMWVFTLDKSDSLLVLRALGGRLKTAEDINAARELGDRLTRLRAIEAETLSSAMRHHALNIAGVGLDAPAVPEVKEKE